jgi:hypothetical protein
MNSAVPEVPQTVIHFIIENSQIKTLHKNICIIMQYLLVITRVNITFADFLVQKEDFVALT